MKKIIISILCTSVILIAIFTAIIMYKTSNNENFEKTQTEVAQEEILDDCTDEYEQEMKNDSTVKANTQEEKTSPNCSITIKTNYKKCGHTKEEYNKIASNLVNLTKKDIQNKYPEYEIEKFTSNEVILYQEKEGECSEHYMVKDKEGAVIVYQILEDGSQKEIEITGITTEYLTETDKINIKNGIQVNGKQQLNQLLEDFE